MRFILDHAAALLAAEFQAIQLLGNKTGQDVLQSRMHQHGYGSEQEYFSMMAGLIRDLESMYLRLRDSNVSLAGFDDLLPEVYAVAFAARTGWNNSASYTGAQRVSKVLIDKLHIFNTLYSNALPGVTADDERIGRLADEIQSLRTFIQDSGIREVDSAIFIQRLDAVAGLLEASPVNLLVVTEQLSSILGLMAMYSSKFEDEAKSKKWRDRIKTSAATLAADLFVSVASQGIISASDGLLALLP